MSDERRVLNRQDVLKEVAALNFPTGQYVVVGGAVLTAHGIRPTHDIDIVATQSILEKLRMNPDWTIAERPAGEPGLASGVIEVYPDVNHPTYQQRSQDLIARAEMIDGFPFATLQDIYLFKKGYGREKDERDMRLIEKYLSED